HRRPKVILFDIGGVVVQSPFQAILDYERAHAIPTGYINHAISASAPNGSWQRLERGQIPLDDAFFDAFRADLCKADVWESYCRKNAAADTDTALQSPPPPPQIDTKALFWSMMRISRTPDPHIYPLLLRLREHAAATTSLTTQQPSLILAALSNTVAFPPGIRDEKGTVFEPGVNLSGSSISQSTTTQPQHQPLNGLFSIFISSAHVGLRKPDPAIYALAVRELDNYVRKYNPNGEGVKPADILFLDDIGQNLRAAREMGMRTLKVELGRTEEAAGVVAEMMGL
ncbi:epoxide hydrolase, partial [Saccharata proteae CBS 121410]